MRARITFLLPTFFLVTSIRSQAIISLKNSFDIQIKSKNNECLSLQQEHLYMSVTENGNSQFSPYAKFTACDPRNSEQNFSYDSKSKQLSTSNGKCATLKPLAKWAHANMDACDVWGDYTNVGTYVYVSDCKKDDVSQRFDFVQTEIGKCGGSFVSECGHGLKLGRTGNGMAISAGEGQDFGEIEILDDLEVRNSEFCVLSETTTIIETTKTITNPETTTVPETTLSQSCPKNTFSSTYTQNADGTGTASGLTAPEIKQYVAMSWGPGEDPLIPGDANGVMGTYSTDGSHFYVAGVGLEGSEGQWNSKKTEGIIIKIKPCDNTSEYSNNIGTILGSAGNNCATQYVWGTKLGGNDGKWDVVLSVKESPNGEFVIAVGAKHADGSGKTSRSMFKIDSSNGDIVWSKMMPNTESDIGFWSGYETVAFTEDGGVIAGGFNYPRNYQLDPIADTDSGAFTFKSGGQIGTEAGVIFDRFSVSAISANSQSAADALSWTIGGAVSWRYQHRSNQEESTENGSMKNCRVFKDAGVEKVIGVGGVRGHVHIVNVSDGSLVSMGKHNDDVIGQCADVEPIVENGVFTGYAQVSWHIYVGDGIMGDSVEKSNFSGILTFF